MSPTEAKRLKDKIKDVGFDPEAYAAKDEAGFDPNAYASEKEENAPKILETVGNVAKAVADPIAAFGTGMLNSASFGGYGELAKRFSGDPEYYEYLGKKYPISMGAGSIYGIGSKFSPAGKILGKVVGPVENLVSRTASSIPRYVLPKPLSSILGFAAKVPLSSGAQQAVSEAAKTFTKGETDPEQKINNVLEAMTDPLTLSLGYGVGSVASGLRKIDLPKNLYAKLGPLNTKDIQRAEEKGRDLIQEAMDSGYTGTIKEILAKARNNMNRYHQRRQGIIDAATDKAVEPVTRREVIAPIKERIELLESQHASPYETGAGEALKNRIKNSTPKILNPRQLEEFLRGQKNYVRTRKTDTGLSNFYSGSPASAEMEFRRELINKGLPIQEGQIESGLGSDVSKRFRDLGRKYGVAANVERGAADDLAKSWGSTRSASTLAGTKAATGIDAILNRGAPLQNYLTVFRELKRRNPEISDEEADRITEEVINQQE